MSPIEIKHLSLRPYLSTHSGVSFFYANLVFKLTEGASEHLQTYLKSSQQFYIKKRIFKTIRDPQYSSVEEMLNSIPRPSDEYLEGYDYNPEHGWFSYNPKFDTWRFHEYFADCVITRACFDMIKAVSCEVPNTYRFTSESQLISIFETLKNWWD
jgi:hypothetical protein